jgi:hypothetical protein
MQERNRILALAFNPEMLLIDNSMFLCEPTFSTVKNLSFTLKLGTKYYTIFYNETEKREKYIFIVLFNIRISCL